VEDDPQLRAATSFMLAGQGYKTQIYASASELLGQRRGRNGCVLLKAGMPGPDVREVALTLEERGWVAPVIVLGHDTPTADAIAALRQGAFDFLERPGDETELIAAVERAMDKARDAGLGRQRRAAALARLAKLSPRKRQVLQGLLAGMSNKVIAQQLALSPRTVELHRATMMEDLEVGSLAEALRMAIDAELTPLNDTLVVEPAPEMAIQPTSMVSSDLAPDSVPSEGWLLRPVREALEGTTDCVFLVDRDWRFTYLNKNAREVLAGERELVGTVLWDEYPLAGATRAWDELHRAAADRQATRFEFYEPDLRSWLDVSVRPFASGLQVAFRNVSGERRAGAQLQLSEDTLRQTLEVTGDGAWDWNVQTGEIAMSEGFLVRLGYGDCPFPQTFESASHLVHPDDLPMLTRCLREHLDGCSPSFRCEYRMRRRNGDWLWNFDRGRVVSRDPVTGLPLRMVGTASDITHIKDAQQKAEAAFERLSLAQANAGVGTWELDLTTGELLFCDQSMTMHGLALHSPVALTEEDWLNTVHPQDRAPALAKLKAHVASGETYRIRYRTVARDGSIRSILGLGKAVTTNQQSPQRFVGLNIDITGLLALASDEGPENGI
jgi:two-component system response regulator FixJ